MRRIPRDYSATAVEALFLASYIALTLLATYPLVFRAGSAIPGGGDAWQFYWNLWWVERALLDLHTTPYFTPDLYFPYGAGLHFHTLNLFQSVLALPLVVKAGLCAAYNGVVFLAFALSGYAMYRLALYVLTREIDPDGADAQPLHARLAAFVAGLTFTFSSYHFAHLDGHLDLLSTQWLPVFVLFLLKTRRERGWRNPAMCAFFLTATTLTSWYYFVFLVLFTALFVAYVVATGGRDRWRAVARIVAALAVSGVFILPVIAPMLALARTEGRTPDPAYDARRFSTDLVAFIVPSYLHPVWGASVAPLYRLMDRRNSGIEAIAFLGYVPLLLAIRGVKAFPRTRAFWLGAQVLFSVLALGPALHVAGRTVAPELSMLMPYGLLTKMPYGDIARGPARFVAMSTLCLSVIAGCGAWAILRGRRRSTAFGLTVVICAIALAENAVAPFPIAAVDVPAFYDRLARETRREGVLEAPIPDDPSSYPRRMLYQTRHGKPVFGGYVSRGLPPLAFEAVPGFSQFKTLSETIDDVVPYDVRQLSAISRAVLDVYKAGHLIVEKDLIDAAALVRARGIADALFGSSSRVHEDSSTLAYTIAPALTPPPPAIWLDTGWSYLERLPESDAAGRSTRWRWMGDRARVGAMAPAPIVVRLKMSALAFGRTRHVRLSAGGTEVATLRVSPEKAEYETPRFPLSGGTTFLTLESLDGADSPRTQDKRRLSVAVFRLELIADGA